MHRNVILLMFSGALLIAAPAKQATSKPADTNPGSSGSQPNWSINCGLWRTDSGFQSTIQIKNRIVTGPTTAQPVLFMADGTEYDLPPITLPAAGVVTVNINDALSGDYLTGVTAGTATLTATANPTLPVSGMYYGYNPSCDELQTYQAFTASVTVTVFDPTPVISGVTPSTFTVGALASAKITGSNLGTTACPMLAFPFALQSGYATSGCSDGGLTVAFTPSAAGSGDLTLTSEGFGGQPFQASPGQKPTAISATISAALPPAPLITALEKYTPSTMAYVNPFAPVVGTLQSSGLYVVIWGSNLTTVNAATTVCITYHQTNASSCGTQTAVSLNGFHLTSAWAPGPSQINIPYYLDATATTGTYSLKVTTIAGSSSWNFTVNPYTEVTVMSWICGSCITLPGGTDGTIVGDLGNSLSCVDLLVNWLEDSPRDLNSQADVNYANAFLLQNSSNTPPPANLGTTPSSYMGTQNFRLFVDYGNPAGNYYAVGPTPQPCHGGVIPNWSVAGASSPYNGSTGVSKTGLPYLLVEGQVGSSGQEINLLLNGNSTPWTWAVIEFPASGPPLTSNRSVFPWFTVYINGVAQSPNPINPSVSISRFATYTSNYLLVPPPNP